MKKLITIIIVIMSIISGYSQNSITEKVNKINAYFQLHSVKSIGAIHFIKNENILAMNGSNIPLLNVSITYRLLNNDKHLVCFECKNQENCISEIQVKEGEIASDNNTDMVAFPFKTENDCYAFIDLIADFKAGLKATLSQDISVSKIKFNPRLGYTESQIRKDFPNDKFNEGTWSNELKSISRVGSFGLEHYYFSENGKVISCSLIPQNADVNHDIVEDLLNEKYKQSSPSHWKKYLNGHVITVSYDYSFKLDNGNTTDCWIYTYTVEK